jgi:hypothetical protein
MEQFVKVNSHDQLVKVSHANERGLPFRSATLYGWKHKGINLHIFRKIGRTLFVDLVELQKLIDGGKVA